MTTIMPLYPVNLKIKNRSCVVIGGGEVAARKIGPLLFCQAKVTVISPTVCNDVSDLAASGKVTWHRRRFRPGDLQGAFLVFAATDDREVQKLVIGEAVRENVLVNSADVPDVCTFQVPATVRQGDLLLAVSTGGASPALSASIRRRLTEEYGFEYRVLVDLFAAIRSAIIGDGGTPASHKHLFEKILNQDVLSCIRDRNWSALTKKLEVILPQTIDVSEVVGALSATEQSAEADSGDRKIKDG